MSCLALVAIGCGDRQPPRAVVRGKVTFEGKPVPRGEIVFQPIGKEWKRFYAQGEIIDGEYEFAERGPVVGRNRVEVHGYKKTGRQSADISGKSISEPVVVIDEVVPYIPAKYNEVSELEFDVQAGENNDVDFEL